MPLPNIGPGELILILIIALVVLGPGKLPDVAASLGKSVREFRRAATDVTDAGKLDTPPATSSTSTGTAPAAPVAAAPAGPDSATPATTAPPASETAAADPEQRGDSPSAPGSDAARDPNPS